MWRKDGKELFYLSQPPRQTVMAVDVTTGGAIQAGTPQRLFELPAPVGAPAQLSNVSSPDGQRFVFAVNVSPGRRSGSAKSPFHADDDTRRQSDISRSVRSDYFSLNVISTSTRTATALPSFVPGSKRHCLMAFTASSSSP